MNKNTKTLNALLQEGYYQPQKPSDYDHSLWQKDNILYICKQSGIEYELIAGVTLTTGEQNERQRKNYQL